MARDCSWEKAGVRLRSRSRAGAIPMGAHPIGCRPSFRASIPPRSCLSGVCTRLETTLSTPEKRKFPRVPLVAPIEIEAGGILFAAELRNISVSGVLIRSDQTLGERQTMRLKFTLPGTQHVVRASGNVQHVSPGAFMGVKFEDLSSFHRSFIEQFVSEAASRQETTEKRRFRRVPFVAQIEARTGGVPFLAMAENISAGGLLVRTTDPVPKGQTVHLEFTLPGSEHQILVNGTVQHVTPGAVMGIRFDHLDPADLAAIRNFVEAV